MPRQPHRQNKISGFTLLEILVALFIFTILSLMLASGLRTVIDAEASTEAHAERLRVLQMTLLLMSRDIEQTVNRPILNAAGHQDPAFIGDSKGFSFTHGGLANPDATIARSSLQRTAYTWQDNRIWRTSWLVLDQAPASQPHKRPLLTNVTAASFEYLDGAGKLQPNWPSSGENNQPLPRAVKITLTLDKWGTLSQLYLISATPSQGAPTSTSEPSRDQ